MYEKKLEDLARYDGEDKVISSHELYLKLKEEPESILNVKSFIPSLDAAMDGFRDGELITISGPTKQGKTLLAESLTVAFEKQQHYPTFFSFEVPPREFLGQFHTIPLIYMPAKLKAYALDWFQERTYESFLKYHSRIVFIDHLHYLIDLARLRNPSLEIGTIVRRLKRFAVSEHFLIFLLCHTTKGKHENGLGFEDIRDSSFISQESDSVLMIRRTPSKGENRAQLRVEFHRRTGVIERLVNLIKVKGYLAEYVEEEYGNGKGSAYTD